jgi:hypothetical protein
MGRRWKVAFACFAANVAIAAAFGVTYLLSPRVMPYHAAAMGIPWSEVAPGEQAALLALMRLGGGGLLVTALASAFLLARPFRLRERWAAHALFAVQITLSLAVLYGMGTLTLLSDGRPPWVAAIAGVLLSVIGYWAAVRGPGRLASGVG